LKGYYDIQYRAPEIFREILLILSFTLILIAPWVMAEEDSRNSTWTSNGPEGGTINSFVQDPSDANILYLASDKIIYNKSKRGGHPC